MIVIDASVVLAWALPGEVRADDATRIVNRVAEQGAVVPAHWHLEVSNGIVLAERRGRISHDFATRTFADLATFPIEADPATQANAWQRTAELARRHRLTVYDAAYLELALRLEAELASFDRQLVDAALYEGLRLLPR
jgi:predicted nucleic acid-binding protein